jgi:hypothetical protein
MSGGVWEAGPGTYRGRRMAAQLNQDGHLRMVGQVADLRHELGLVTRSYGGKPETVIRREQRP